MPKLCKEYTELGANEISLLQEGKYMDHKLSFHFAFSYFPAWASAAQAQRGVRWP